MVELVWHNEPRQDQVTVEQSILADLNQPMYADILQRPSRLITHTVFLGASMDAGPAVHVWGEEGDDDNLHCEWIDHVEWTTLSDIDEAE